MIQYSTSRRICSFSLVAGTLAFATLAGCRNDAQNGVLLGSGAGAGLGAIVGHQSGHGAEGALIGAGAGALGGYIWGNESDKQRHWRSSNYDY